MHAGNSFAAPLVLTVLRFPLKELRRETRQDLAPPVGAHSLSCPAVSLRGQPGLDLFLNRPLTRTYPDTGVEAFGYTPNIAGLTSHTNKLKNVTLFAYDALGRKTNEVAVGVTTNGFAYDGAGDLLALTDGRNQPTVWHYDSFGRVTNKVDAAGVVAFVYQYDANNRLTNRWTPEKGNTRYTYDAVGNQKAIVYPQAAISFAYDSLNRLTNVVDGLGTSTFSYTLAGELQSAGGLWSGDTVSYSYNNRLRSGLTVGAWSQSYGYDGVLRLTNVTSGAGSFGYAYDSVRRSRVARSVGFAPQRRAAAMRGV